MSSRFGGIWVIHLLQELYYLICYNLCHHEGIHEWIHMILSVTSFVLNRAVSYTFRAWAFNKLLKTLATEH